MRNFYLLLLCFFVIPCSGQSINSTLLETNFGGDSEPDHLTKIGTKIYFSAEINNDRELYVKDDLTTKPRLVKNINTNNESISSASFFKDFNGTLLFTAASNTVGNYYRQLWRSDGTNNGTYLVKIINPNYDANIVDPVILNNKMFFISSVNNSNDLWVTDGTDTGTKIVKKINPTGNSNAMHPFVFNNLIYFLASDGITGNELWKSDGTELGTSQVLDLNVGSYSTGFTKPIIYNNKIYFMGSNHLNQQGLWSYDGTQTQLIKSLPDSNSFEAVIFQNKIFFTTYGSNGLHLWQSDGTTGNTTPLLSNPSTTILAPGEPLRVINNKLFFSVFEAPFMSAIWSSEGTAQSTVSLSSYIPQLANTILVKVSSDNKYLIFRKNNNPQEFYITDGTISGTKLIPDINLNYNYSAYSLNALDYNNLVVLNGENKKNGVELFTYNWLTNSSTLLDDINHKFSSDINGSASLNNNLIYFGNTFKEGMELFFSDGTINNTSILKDLNPGDYSTVWSGENNILFKNGNKLYFRCSVGSGFEPCVTDGTAQGTYMIKDLSPYSPGPLAVDPFFMALNDNVTLFLADDGTVSIRGLWRTDGSSVGTYKIHDVRIVNAGTYYGNNQYANFNGKVYFTGADSNNLYSIWETDGTPAGTTIFRTFYNSLGGNEIPRILNTVNNKLVIVVNDKTPNGQYFQDFWSTDGTSPTSMVKFARYRKHAEYDSGVNVSNTIVFNNKLYFYTWIFDGSYPTDAYKIYITDGTVGGTTLFSSIIPGCCTMDIKFMACNNQILILKNKLYTTDGINSPSELTDGSQTFKDFNCINNKFYFLNTQFQNNKIWVSDGSSAGTFPLNLYANGHQISNNESIYKLAATGDKLFYNANFYNTLELKDSGSENYIVDLSSQTLSSNQEVDIFDKSGEEFIIFPNPAQTVVNVQNLKGKNIKSLRIHDASGKLVTNVLSNKNKVEVDVQNLPTGLYFLIISTDTGIITKKLIKD
jgi:ELWxxDGT repeat protein